MSQKIKNLHKAVAAYAEKTGVNAATFGVLAEKIIGLLAARWEHICDSAADEENGGKIALAMSIGLDMTAKCPVGKVGLRFIPKRVNDGVEFAVADPDQTVMNLEEEPEGDNVVSALPRTPAPPMRTPLVPPAPAAQPPAAAAAERRPRRVRSTTAAS